MGFIVPVVQVFALIFNDTLKVQAIQNGCNDLHQMLL